LQSDDCGRVFRLEDVAFIHRSIIATDYLDGTDVG